MAKISLMPEGFKSTGRPKLVIYYFTSTILLGLCLLSFAVFFVWNMYLQNNLKNLNQEINSLPTLETLITQDKINKLGYLLNSHIYWTGVFEAIEELCLKNVYFKSFSGDAEKRQISLTANLPSYAVLAKQIKAFEQNFSKVDFTSSGLAKEGGLNIIIDLQNVDLSKN